MTIATGVAKVLSYKKETSWGAAAPTRTGGSLLRRITSNLNLAKQTYGSNEIRADQQRADFRHGVRSVSGTINGDMAVGSYVDFFLGLSRQSVYQTGGATTSQSLSVTATGFGRASGSFITDGHVTGDIVKATGLATTGATANNRNFLIVALTATAMDGIFLDTGNAPLAGEVTAAATGVSIALVGKKCYAPLTGQVDTSFAIEHWFSDVTISELFLGCKVSQAAIKLPSTGIADVTWTMMGKDMADVTVGRGGVAANTQYLTSPSAASTGSSLSAVNGAVIVGGVKVGNVTGMDFTVTGNYTTGEVIGSNVHPDVFRGRLTASGTLTAYFQDAVMRDLFVNETEAQIVCAMTADNTGTAGVIAFNLPRVKMGGSSKDDGDKGIVQTLPFEALLNNAGAAGTLASTFSYQDSSAT